MNSRFRYSWRRMMGDLSGGAIAALIALPYGFSLRSVLLGVRAVVDRTSNNMLYQSWQVSRLTGRTQPSALIVGGVVIVVGLLCARYFPKAPAPLLGVLVSVAVALLFGVHQREVGRLRLEVPPFAAFSWTPADVVGVVPAASSWHLCHR